MGDTPTAPATDQPQTTPPSEPIAAKPARPELYYEIPIRGVIGREVIAVGVQHAIDAARRKHIAHIVFLIDCPGGDRRETRAIARLLAVDAGTPSDDALQYHAVIEGEMSGAAMVFAAGAHTVHARPAARFGPGDLNAADESSKDDAAWLREIESLAEARGHEPLFFRAGIEPGAELYAWLDDEGRASFADGRPSRADADDPQRLDSKVTLLSMSGAEMDRWGFAARWDDAIGALGAALGYSVWRSAGPRGEELLRDAAGERREIVTQIDAARSRVRELVADAEAGDPRKIKLKTEKGSLLTGTSQVAWREAADASIARWSRIREEMTQVVKLENRARENGADHLLPVIAEDLAHEANRRMHWLRANRSRHYIDLPGRP